MDAHHSLVGGCRVHGGLLFIHGGSLSFMGEGVATVPGHCCACLVVAIVVFIRACAGCCHAHAGHHCAHAGHCGTCAGRFGGCLVIVVVMLVVVVVMAIAVVVRWRPLLSPCNSC